VWRDTNSIVHQIWEADPGRRRDTLSTVQTLEPPTLGLPLIAPTTKGSDLTQIVVMIAPPECASILSTVMRPLPSNLDAAVLVLVHGTAQRSRLIATKLNKGRFLVEAGQTGTQLRNGHAVVVLAESFVAVGEGNRLTTYMPETVFTSGSGLLKSALQIPGTLPTVVVLTSLDSTEKALLEPVRSQGRLISLDDRGRGWLHEKVPAVVCESGDVYLSAEDIGAEIARVVAAGRLVSG
jgi:chemotaxis response regulator CheB